MAMDHQFSRLTDSVNRFLLEDENIFSSLKRSPDIPGSYNVDSLPLDNVDAPLVIHDPNLGSYAPTLDYPDDHDSDTVLKYLNQILLEENIDENPSMFYDPIALKAAENSFYEALKEKPPSPHQAPLFVNSNARSPDSILPSSGGYSTSSSSIGSCNADPQWIVDPGESKSSVTSYSPEFSFQSSSQANSYRLNGSLNSFSSAMNAQTDSFVNANLVPNIFSDTESILQFKRGMEEASRFLPTGNQLVIDLDKYSLPPKTDELSGDAVIKIEKDEKDRSANSSRGKKHHHPDDSGLEEEERSSKHSAVYEEEVELSEVFDRVLLCTDNYGCNVNVEGKQQNGASGGKGRTKKQGGNRETVDLRSLLSSCAQSIAAADYRTANDQLKKIRQHSSPSGDPNQRLASVFANGLEARLAGTGTQLYAALAPKTITASEKLKAYHTYLSFCPFKRIAIFFANKMIYDVASKGSTLHVIDFGIFYGFQWPILIQHLSQRPGGPPKLRVTGIELPHPGFRPAEKVEQTGRRLANYCERFGVQFEYNAIASQNWETIKIDDLKLASGDVVAVNCLFRFKNLLDETAVADSPRDAVLSLIRKINPNIYVQAVISGSYSSPFFVTRFREALFFYSAVFDMFDATLSRDDHQRLDFEQEFIGREIMNVVACEGMERLERPETYKQWQVRNMRAGFKPLPVKPELVKKLRGKVKAGYHKDFVFDEDGHWILQGWKGRIMCGSSCWVPA
nr:scarecrow-like protein 14 [Ipomoea trifida]